MVTDPWSTAEAGRARWGRGGFLTRSTIDGTVLGAATSEGVEVPPDEWPEFVEYLDAVAMLQQEQP